MQNFSTEFSVEWGDCDDAGIVFYPNYFYWLDCTFQRLLRSRGLGQRQNQTEFGAVTPLVDVGMQFRAPVRYDESIRVEANIAEWQEKQFRIVYRVICGEKLVAEGYEVRAWAALTETGLRGAPISAEFKRRMT
ncbi:acyl-CoA thioesterase [Agrobacterium rosae]|uniref:4-hydroxybenzoyl-CoA thioesterase n=1 Tax=Agrobacterium rosae TaxID=1972867 RepID=A0A1R3U3U2_9HYPH|nr:acyl-CoA thioesterase [Agrobacterium rosae]SCX35281.1 4-hydroxybenzoyl-CoA thioesterase [Agrobacterium rosae]